MTIIAGVSLFNGIMLASDCRVTVRRAGRRSVHCDVAQKIFPLTNTTAIGFSGDVATAALVLQELFRQLRHRKQFDPVNLHQWLPRFLRSRVGVLRRKNRARPVDFIVGSVIPSRCNVIERQRCAELLREIAYGNASIQRNWVPDVLMRAMITPPDQHHVVIANSVAGLMCTMTYPAYQPKHIRPLEFVAIGSGRQATVELKRTADWLLAGMPGNDFIESQALTSAVSQFVAEQEIQDVGGMYPCVKIDQRGVSFLGARHRYPLYEVSLTYDGSRSRWTQENHTTGKKIELLYPWEIMRRPGLKDQKFEDMRQAMEHANPLRARRAASITRSLPSPDQSSGVPAGRRR